MFLWDIQMMDVLPKSELMPVSVRYSNDGCIAKVWINACFCEIFKWWVRPKSGLMLVSVRYLNDGWDQSLD